MTAVQSSGNAVQAPGEPLQRGCVLAILSGNSITTWEYDALDPELQQPVTRFPQGDLPISNFCWNHNRMVLASCSAVPTDQHIHHNIMLIAFHSGSRLDSFQHDVEWGRHGVANCLQFGGKSRYLCVGDESGAVCLWDLKKKLRVRQFFHNHHPARQVSLDPTDTYVLSLTPYYMYIYNLRDGNLIATFAPPGNEENEEANTLVFSKYCTTSLEPSIVAVGASDGSIFLFDINEQTESVDQEDQNQISPIHPFLSLAKRHQGSVTDLAFSPTSSNSLVSSGEDGVLRIHDITTGETVRSIQMVEKNTPITSLSLYVGDENNILCAIGCETGDVHVYDLDAEKDDTPVASLNVNASVREVSFAPAPRIKDKRAAQSSPKTPASSRTALPMEPTPAKFRVREATSRSSIGNEGAVSKSTDNESKKETILQPQENIPQPTTKTYSSPFASALRKSPLSPRRTTIVQAARQNSAVTTKSSQTLGGKTVDLAGSPKQSQPPSGVSSPSSQHSQSEDVNAQPLAIRSKTTRSTFMHARSGIMQKHLYHPRQQENSNPERQGTNQVDIDEIREVVQEEIENMQDELGEQLRNLHLDMISQFHLQSQEMNKALSNHLAAIESLKDENKRLHDENEKLRQGR